KLFSLILTMCTLKSLAQADENAIKAVINNMFNGMRKSDSALIHSAFAPKPILQTIIKNKEGKVMVRSEVVDSFIIAVSRPHKEVFDERITFDMIKIDGDLATVWTPYQFFIDEKFSHCGVNSFQLVRLNGEWKIQYLIDTRRRQDCK
ncbi:MAG TPA: nuclear transport factor 2 family protein, partial [Chitinophagaceae bacterium]|nr:nuclear transport factor 2 family protein [Chitinophagaceae bacterium]